MALPRGDVGSRLLLLVTDGRVGAGLEDDADDLLAAHGGGDVQRSVAVLKECKLLMNHDGRGPELTA